MKNLIAIFALLLTLVSCEKIDLSAYKDTPETPSEKEEGSKGTEKTDDAKDAPTEPEDDYSFGSDEGATFGDTVYVMSMPEPADICGGHVVAYVDGNEGLLISLAEWERLYSANNEKHSADAADIAASYVEDGVSGWSIPTRAQAQQLRELWAGSDRIEMISQSIEYAGGLPLTIKDVSANNIRFLCEDAAYTFSFVKSGSGSAILAAGKTVRTYHLRLVKPIYIIEVQ